MTTSTPLKVRIHRGDTVRVLRGKDRGKKARVMAVVPQEGRVIVEGVNMVKKHVRPRRGSEKGQRVTVASPLPVSNVQLVCGECKKSTRISLRRQPDGSRERICKKCGAVLALPKR